MKTFFSKYLPVLLLLCLLGEDMHFCLNAGKEVHGMFWEFNKDLNDEKEDKKEQDTKEEKENKEDKEYDKLFGDLIVWSAQHAQSKSLAAFFTGKYSSDYSLPVLTPPPEVARI